ncbi:zinc finger protein-like [Tropilaelaps mercedesae]|uniref:Zinc finger protein-like n=1 Tax=Tropilaelaps mercedesae TaxID=418985 RepID=A0A1V9X1P6_9ACAR|nr:zinc finger protein-like [Tropilaelaps mercedesae]
MCLVMKTISRCGRSISCLGLNLAPVVTSTVKEEQLASSRTTGPLAPFERSSPVLSSNGILTDRATGMHCCQFCGYVSSNRGNVTYHIRSKHTGERPFGCTFCDYRSSRKTTLRLHMKRHRPFVDVQSGNSTPNSGFVSPVSAISPIPAATSSQATTQASSDSLLSTLSSVSPIPTIASVTPLAALTAGISPLTLTGGSMDILRGVGIDLITGKSR